jgi:hypothetical protein
MLLLALNTMFHALIKDAVSPPESDDAFFLKLDCTCELQVWWQHYMCITAFGCVAVKQIAFLKMTRKF